MDKLTEMICDNVSTIDECWIQAKITLKEMNKEIDEDFESVHPKWRFDCNFKLDFDGSVIMVLSRFYPPPRSNRNMWYGDIGFHIGKICFSKRIEAKDLDSLKEQAHAVFESTTSEIFNLINYYLISNFDEEK